MGVWLQVPSGAGLASTRWRVQARTAAMSPVSINRNIASIAAAVGLGAGDTSGFLVVCALSGLALGADLTVPGALLNQLIDRCGERGRSDGAFMGWWNLATKLNLALAAGLSLPLLGLWGYAPGRQDADAVLALGLAYGLLPCGLKLLAGLALYWGLMRQPELASSSDVPTQLAP